MCGCLLHTHYWGPDPQPRHVSWLGIKLATPWFTGQHSIHWATPARANFSYILKHFLIFWLTRCFQLILYFQCLGLRINLFLKEFWFLLLNNSIWVLAILIAPRLSLSKKSYEIWVSISNYTTCVCVCV